MRRILDAAALTVIWVLLVIPMMIGNALANLLKAVIVLCKK